MNNSSLVGSKLGKYQIESEIGRGGMGTVYKALDPVLDRYVAIKVLAPHLVWERDFVERFLREARAATRLAHPNIVTIHDVGQAGGWHYYVMEYLQGQTLTEAIQREGPMSPERVVTILRPLADALDYAHHSRLVHRDIKPGNIVMGPHGRVWLTDFGIARAAQERRLTGTGMIIDSPEYMSPEHTKGLTVDARSDQYSLAVVAFEALSGHTPFHSDSTLSLMYKVVHEPPPSIREIRPNLPEEMAAVLDRALSRQPGDRYPSVTAFVDAMEATLSKKKPTPAAPIHPAKAKTSEQENLRDPKHALTVALEAARPTRPLFISGPEVRLHPRSNRINPGQQHAMQEFSPRGDGAWWHWSSYSWPEE